MKWTLLLACLAGCNLDFFALIDGDETGGGDVTSSASSDSATTSAASTASVGGSGGEGAGGTSGGAGGVGGGPYCGDGTRQLPEQCDDGNLISGDGCSSECSLVCADFSATAFLGPDGPDCYDVESGGPKTWSQCLSACLVLGPALWHLATLSSTLQGQEAAPMSQSAWVWVGGHRMTDGGTDWVWLDQANFTIQASAPWDTGEPVATVDDNGVPIAANCTALTGGGKLRALPCAWLLGCGCEGDPPGE